MRLIDAGEPITMFGDGSTSRDYTYIGDIVAGVLAAYDKTPAFGFRVWNLGSDRPVRLDELIDAIARVAGKPPVINRAGMQPGDVDRTWADVSRAREELGYAARTPLDEGLRAQWDARPVTTG
jgi:UDP-glucuronate 4-epimerase